MVGSTSTVVDSWLLARGSIAHHLDPPHRAALVSSNMTSGFPQSRGIQERRMPFMTLSQKSHSHFCLILLTKSSLQGDWNSIPPFKEKGKELVDIFFKKPHLLFFFHKSSTLEIHSVISYILYLTSYLRNHSLSVPVALSHSC